MAKKAYVGVDNTARNVKNIYVGVDGVARKVVKGYVGVNGVARLFWDGGSSSIGSWDYWTSKAETIFSASTGDSISKYNNKIAYFAVAYVAYPRWIAPMHIMISPDADAVSWQLSGDARVYTYHDTITDKNGIEWYISGGEAVWVNDYVTFTPNCIINTKQNPYDGSPSNTHLLKDIAQDLLDRIYAVPFHEDYQTGQTYTLTTTNLRRTIRKAIGTYLHRNTVRYRAGYAYKLLSDDADNIIDLIITEITNKGSQEGLIYISIPGGALSFDIAVAHGTQGSIGQNTNQVPNATLTSQGVSYNYEHKYFRSDGYAQYSDVGAYPDWVTYVHIVTSTMSYETINAYSTQVDSIPYMAGLNLFSDKVSLTNLGIDL